MNSINDTAVRGSDVEHLMTKLRDRDPGSFIVLEPGDPFYKDPREEWVRDASELTKEAARTILDGFAADESYFYEGWFADTYNAAGEKVPNSPGLGADREAEFEVTPNAAIVIDDLIFVSRGSFVAGTVDGTTITFVSSPAYRARMRARNAAAIAEFLPMAKSATPSWAVEVNASEMSASGDEIDVMYSSEKHNNALGVTYVVDFAYIDEKKREIKFTDDGPSPIIRLDEGAVGRASADDLRQLAADVLKLADVVAAIKSK